jgi:ATP-binding cassette, subfamily A (ABC1), member 3
LNANGKVPVKTIAEYVHMETLGNNLLKFLRENFGEVSIIEHFQSVYKIKIYNTVKLSRMFGALQSNVPHPT